MSDYSRPQQQGHDTVPTLSCERRSGSPENGRTTLPPETQASQQEQGLQAGSAAAASKLVVIQYLHCKCRIWRNHDVAAETLQYDLEVLVRLVSSVI